MSSLAQQEANRANSLSSTGPKTEEGKQRSSLNATSHRFTGQLIVVSANETAAYENHCLAYLEQYQPKTHEETDLVQQFADQHWTLHQIAAQQISVLSLLNLTISEMMQKGAELDAINAATAAFYKQISTLGTYEQRRRRAAAETRARFEELVAKHEEELQKAAQICTSLKAQAKPFNPQEFGFVHSLSEIEAFLTREARRADAKKPIQK